MNYYKLRLFAFGAILIKSIVINCYASHPLKQELDLFAPVVLNKRSDIDSLLTDDHNNHFSNIQLNQNEDITRTDYDRFFENQLPIIVKLTINGFNDDILDLLVKHLPDNDKLQELNLLSDNLQTKNVDQKIVRRLFDVLAIKTTLKKAILKVLNLSGNLFEETSAIGLIKFLNKPQGLESLILKETNINDFEKLVGIETLINALNQHKYLTCLHLSNNKSYETLPQELAQLIENIKSRNKQLLIKHDASFEQFINQKEADRKTLTRIMEGKDKGISFKNEEISIATLAYALQKGINYNRVRFDYDTIVNEEYKLDKVDLKKILDYVSSNAESLTIISGTGHSDSYDKKIIEDLITIINNSEKLKVLKLNNVAIEVGNIEKLVSALQDKGILLKLLLNMHVNEKVLTTLLEGCEKLNRLQELELSRQILTTETLPVLAKFITNSKSLTSLTLSDGAFVSSESNTNDQMHQKLIKSFFQACKKSVYLKELVFEAPSNQHQRYDSNFKSALKDFEKNKKFQDQEFKIKGINLEQLYNSD